ncbi:endothelial lipase isoform X1 [Aquila chrysaetos chrysaetos]|uniref:endothelial lipase isoform X1 n=1 Tax=Aquila chrysaetos chrysaetos TaxID=223781 RepID=UPI0005D043A2|nr:endothelial lipase isoform X1 [Aquila chrysaetos chrysaetos]
MRSLVLLLCTGLTCCTAAGSSPPAAEAALLREDATLAQLLEAGREHVPAAKAQVKFNLRSSPDAEEDGCPLAVGHRERLEDCKFNATAKTFFIIHGWTMSGMFETWLGSLVSALQKREKDANVVVVDWLSLAHQLYTDAVNNTQIVGKSIARLLDWLQENPLFQLENVHLIGYSLGAHVAGFAGNHVHGTIGRITGLDPAGPMFEGVDPSKRLSPDDANFVDVLHTYTRETLGVSIGIQMPVGHVDIYPNGGDFQPGCGLGDVLGAIAYGTIGEVVKCEHERSVHLFVDSLVNQDKQSFAFQCTDSSRFKKGICLSCRKNRCSGIGYNARKTRNKRNSKMYLKTRADMPFKVYHFQMKMHVFSYKSLGEADPTFSVTLHGTNGDSEPLSLEMLDQIGLNATNTFLVYTEKDMGELLKIKLTWEGTSQSWYDLWKELKSYWYRPVKSSQELHIRRIRVKSGETQQRFAFCVEDSQLTNISPGKELWFVKCTGEWQKRSVSNSL